MPHQKEWSGARGRHAASAAPPRCNRGVWSASETAGAAACGNGRICAIRQPGSQPGAVGRPHSCLRQPAGLVGSWSEGEGYRPRLDKDRADTRAGGETGGLRLSYRYSNEMVARLPPRGIPAALAQTRCTAAGAAVSAGAAAGARRAAPPPAPGRAGAAGASAPASGRARPARPDRRAGTAAGCHRRRSGRSPRPVNRHGRAGAGRRLGSPPGTPLRGLGGAGTRRRIRAATSPTLSL